MKTFKCKNCGKPVDYSVILAAMNFQIKRGKADTQVYSVTCPYCEKKFPFTSQDNEVMKVMKN